MSEEVDQQEVFHRVAEVLGLHAPVVYRSLLMAQGSFLPGANPAASADSSESSGKFWQIERVLKHLCRAATRLPNDASVGVDEEFAVEELLFDRWDDYVLAAIRADRGQQQYPA